MKINDYLAIKVMRHMIANDFDMISCIKRYRELTDEGLYFCKKLYEKMLADIKNENSGL